jgi:hypothetical protein
MPEELQYHPSPPVFRGFERPSLPLKEATYNGLHTEQELQMQPQPALQCLMMTHMRHT